MALLVLVRADVALHLEAVDHILLHRAQSDLNLLLDSLKLVDVALLHLVLGQGSHILSLLLILGHNVLLGGQDHTWILAVEELNELGGIGSCLVIGHEKKAENRLEEVRNHLLIIIINSKLQDILLDEPWVFSVKRIPLHYEVIESASQGPHIHFARKLIVFHNKLRRGIVDMA